MNKAALKQLFLSNIPRCTDKGKFIDCSPEEALQSRDLEEENPAYYKEYKELYQIRNFENNGFVPWGSTDVQDVTNFKTSTEKIFASNYDDFYVNVFIPNKQRQIAKVEKFFLENFHGRKGLCIDVSGGAGEYAIMLSKYFGVVLQCDLYEPNLLYSYDRHQKLGVNNILLVKCDYLQAPNLKFLDPDLIICFDTLIRGNEHDKILVSNLEQLSKEHTELYVDFYNKNHNVINRLLKRGYLKHNYGYTLSRFLSKYWPDKPGKILKINYYKNIFGVKVVNPFQPTFYLVNIK